MEASLQVLLRWLVVLGACGLIAATSTIFLASVLALTLGAALRPLLTPTVETIDAPLDDTPNQPAAKPQQQPKAVVFAGSMNPPHSGHLRLICHLHQRYGRVLVVVGANPKKRYAVSPQARVELIEQMCAALPGVSAHVVEGYVWQFAMAHQAAAMYRGIRSWKLDGASETWLHLLNRVGPLLCACAWPLPTRFLQGDPAQTGVSSTTIRRRVAECSSEKEARAALGDSGLVPREIVSAVWRAYRDSSSAP